MCILCIQVSFDTNRSLLTRVRVYRMHSNSYVFFCLGLRDTHAHTRASCVEACVRILRFVCVCERVCACARDTRTHVCHLHACVIVFDTHTFVIYTLVSLFLTHVCI